MKIVVLRCKTSHKKKTLNKILDFNYKHNNFIFKSHLTPQHNIYDDNTNNHTNTHDKPPNTLKRPKNQPQKGEQIKMDKNEFIGNLTTILKILIMTIAPTVAVYIGVDQQTLLTFLTACITFIIAIIDAKYPNTILDKTTNEPTVYVNLKPNELSNAINEAQQQETNKTEDGADDKQ